MFAGGQEKYICFDNCSLMFFSKTFGYALRGILYIALMKDEKRYVQVEEIATRLVAPRHFMGKILKRLAKEGMITSIKGPMGGFRANLQTLSVRLTDVMAITDGNDNLEHCVLRAKDCGLINPCPLHFSVEPMKKELLQLLSGTTIGGLMKEDKFDFVRSISGTEMPIKD